MGKPIDPVIVDAKDAPCKANILTGDDANLLHLPGPMVHDGDGGRYLATWHFVVSKDPETQAINWGMYRMMVFDEKTMVGPVLPFSDMGKMFYGKYVPKNQPMPFAAVLSADPVSSLASCAPSPIPEDQLAGMLMGEPVELVKCETCDLYVPAHAEIIIEGEVMPNIQIEEAPFGEYTGYRTSPREPRTVYRVKTITYRNNPIVMVTNPGIPTDENQLLRSFSLGLEMQKLLESQGIPITGCFMLPESTHHMVVVGVRPAYSNIASQIANLIYGSKLSPWCHMVIVVDQDTDIYNKDEVIHALSTKCHPARGIRILRERCGHAAESIRLTGGAQDEPGGQGAVRLHLPAGLAQIRPAHQGVLQLHVSQGDPGESDQQLGKIRILRMPLIDVQDFSRRAESLVVGRHLGHGITYMHQSGTSGTQDLLFRIPDEPRSCNGFR